MYPNLAQHAISNPIWIPRRQGKPGGFSAVDVDSGQSIREIYSVDEIETERRQRQSVHGPPEGEWAWFPPHFMQRWNYEMHRHVF